MSKKGYSDRKAIEIRDAFYLHEIPKILALHRIQDSLSRALEYEADAELRYGEHQSREMQEHEVQMYELNLPNRIEELKRLQEEITNATLDERESGNVTKLPFASELLPNGAQIQTLIESGLCQPSINGTVRAVVGLIKIFEEWRKLGFPALPTSEVKATIKQRNGKDYTQKSIEQARKPSKQA